jgi:hypothetical protein
MTTAPTGFCFGFLIDLEFDKSVDATMPITTLDILLMSAVIGIAADVLFLIPCGTNAAICLIHEIPPCSMCSAGACPEGILWFLELVVLAEHRLFVTVTLALVPVFTEDLIVALETHGVSPFGLV